MGKYQYEWWTVEIIEATGKCCVEFKARNEAGARKQVAKYAEEHDQFVQRVRPDFKTVVLWETLKLDRAGYQRRF